MGFDSSGSLASRIEAVQTGAATGALAAVLRGALTVASAGYCVGRAVHRGLYESGLRRRHRLPRPVISVGNLTAGGTGKTPFVAWLAAALIERGLRPVVLARGYGRVAGESHNEEGRWLIEKVPGLTVLQDPDRVAVAQRFLAEDSCDLFLLDDGFQHERLRRDHELVLLDGLRPFGHGHRLPRGLLRDAPDALRRADQIVITRAELLAEADLSALEQRIASLAPGVPVTSARFEIGDLQVGETSRPATDLAGRKVVLVCAVGNPESVIRTATSLGAEVVERHVFPDHHVYSRDDVANIRGAASGDAVVVVTEKDHVKLRELWPDSSPPMWVLRQSVTVDGAAELLDAATSVGRSAEVGVRNSSAK